jgi:hypothetical protein
VRAAGQLAARFFYSARAGCLVPLELSREKPGQPMACFIDTLSALTNGDIAAAGGVRGAALRGIPPAGLKWRAPPGAIPIPF